MKKVLIIAGGTGGHVIPALEIAKAMQRQEIEVHWLGTNHGMENDLVPKANISLITLPLSGWRGKGLKPWLLAPFSLLKSLFRAIKIIKRINPDVVLGMGGYASGPGGLASWLLRKPFIIHEQNSIPGLTNRVLALIANPILEAFPQSFAKSRHRVITTGNPVRETIVSLPAPRERLSSREDSFRLLILGGSQGAQVINQVLPNALSILDPQERPQIWHQTGKMGLNETRRMYHLLGLDVKMEAFIENMAEAYAWADLVVCRAGALTVSELAAAGVGSILIPYPYAVDQHQLHNAKYLQQGRAGIIMPQTEFNSVRLSELLRKLIRRRESLLEMAEAARKLSHGDATQKVIENCLNLQRRKK